MIRIGDFAKLSRVTVRTLRYYEEMGLLKPVQVDNWTGYRYCTMDQLPRLNRILAYKDLGFSLDQIALMLRQDLPVEQLRGMLRLKQAELENQVQDATERLLRVAARLAQIEMEDQMPEYDVIVKNVPDQKVLAVHGIIPNQEQVTPTLNRLFDEVLAHAAASGATIAGAPTALWYDPGMGQDMAVAAVIPVSNDPPAGEAAQLEELPGVPQMACVVHHGSFAGLGQAYHALMSWLETNAYTINGPTRELYLEYERDGDQSKYVTELQFPVQKA